MNGLPYYKAYPRDFVEGTAGMRFELKGAYRLVLDLIYMQGGKLPDDARYISGLLGCSVKKWNGLRIELIELGKISAIGNSLTNLRAITELEILSKYQDKQSENASRPRKNKDLQQPNASHTEPDTDTEQNKEDTSLRSVTREPDEFERWYAHFPNKVGKEAARKAWPKARKKASYELLCGGLRRYLKKTDDRPWCNPATWLNQGRWLDEPPVQAASKPKGAELFFVEAERLKNERYTRQPWEDGGSDRSDANGFPILELEYKSGHS